MADAARVIGPLDPGRTVERTDDRLAAFARSGAVAGLASVVAFAVIHAVLITDIWFMLVPMLMAGALCGLCVAWTYTLLVPVPSAVTWLAYNATYLALFVLLGAASIAVFDPIATIAELTAMSGAPGELIGRSMPLNIVAVVVGTALVSLLFGGSRRELGPVLLTVALLVLFLGHNVSILGLVAVGASELVLVAEFGGLILAINAVFAGGVLALEWRRLRLRP